MHSIIHLILIPISVFCVLAANANGQQSSEDMSKNLTKYVKVKLEADLSHLSANQKKMIPLLIEAASEMDKAFWKQAYGDPTELNRTVKSEALKKHIQINYGPWERLQENRPFISGQSPKPLGSNFYPSDMSKDEFETAVAASPDLKNLYTMVRRNPKTKELYSIPYSDYFQTEFKAAAAKLREAADLAEDDGFKAYLLARSEAL